MLVLCGCREWACVRYACTLVERCVCQVSGSPPDRPLCIAAGHTRAWPGRRCDGAGVGRGAAASQPQHIGPLGRELPARRSLQAAHQARGDRVSVARAGWPARWASCASRTHTRFRRYRLRVAFDKYTSWALADYIQVGSHALVRVRLLRSVCGLTRPLCTRFEWCWCDTHSGVTTRAPTALE